MKWNKRLVGIFGAVALVAAAVWFFRPNPVGVDLATVARSSMEVTVDDEARTRIRQVYTVSAPLAGKVLRTPLQVGDQVTADETVVAVMQPSTPAFHDVRTHDELRGALAAADAAVTLAGAEQRRIEAALSFARSDLKRAQPLAEKGTISQAALDKAVLVVDTNEAALASAKAQLQVRRYERASVAARVGNPSAIGVNDSDCCIRIQAPVTGQVLKRVQESEAVVPAGAALVEIGNPLDLEIVADLLSTDAVRIKPNAAVHIDGWGGPPVKGRVKRIEPAGFLKVSALGIEEQRVRTIVDFTDPPEAWKQLGHDYRVIVHVETWKGDNVLTVPVSALFRIGDNWAVFTEKDGKALTTQVEIGQRNSRVAEVLSGLSEGDRVVLHPSDRVAGGTRIAQRKVD
ncbi:MAG: HlyD family efflux transporter periplasmic adaptor subunit [Rhodospirillaceae bacterium]|nr:HlyD family efflux transporter periplasmic adaptor subunit [Rhodospirillaceae bacterium]